MLHAAADLRNGEKLGLRKVWNRPRKDCAPFLSWRRLRTLYGIDFSVKRGECEFISALDVQRESKKTIFGGGLLLSERMAAERMAEERENAIVWELSERERAIIAGLK